MFMVKNLYYLLEKLKSINIELIAEEEGLDFSYTKQSIIGLIYGPKKFKEYNWLSFISDTLPKLQQSQRDIKKELLKRFDDNYVKLVASSVSLAIPHIISFLALTDRVETEERAEEIKKDMHDSAHPELFLDIIKKRMQETKEQVYELLVQILRSIEAEMNEETYSKLRRELLITATQEITKSIQKWYDRLYALLSSEEYDSLNLPSTKSIYEIVSKAISVLATKI